MAGVPVRCGPAEIIPIEPLWPGFAREIEAATGQTIGYRDEGPLRVALDRDDPARLHASYDSQRRLGLDPAWLGAAEVRRREPHLHPALAGAVFNPDDHQ